MKPRLLKSLLLAALPAFWLGLTSAPLQAQVTYTWNNSGTDPSIAAAWSPAGGPPTAADIAQFTPGGSAFNTAVNNPIFGSAFNALSLTTALNQNLGGWNFTGAGSITLGGTGSTGITTFGTQTTILNGPTLAGSSATNTLSFNVTSGSVLVLSGTTAVTANQGNIFASGGVFRLDNAGTNNNTRVLSTGNVTVAGSGTLELIGNSAGTSQNVGTLQVPNNGLGGLNTIRVVANTTSAPTTLTFANTATFTLRPGTRAVTRFEGVGGNLGDANGPQVRFVGTPFTGSGGLFSNTAGAATVGFGIVANPGGTFFATYGANGVTAASTTTVTDAASLQALANTTNAQFNPAAATTITTTGAIVAASLRISPGAGATLATGTNNIGTVALMLDGPENFTISGTGTFAAGGTHYIYVNNPSTILTTSLVVGSGANPFVFAGPGFLSLNGTATQNTNNTSKFSIVGGTLRANSTQVGFGATGGTGLLSIVGGVLEITNGINSATGDFARPLGAAAAQVNFGAGTTQEIGSGGFSAFGSNASVNIGGNASPTALQWNATNFIANEYSLLFGSTKSNAVLTFLNPINLENGTAYQSREIRVTRGVGGDKTVLAGEISGSTGVADLVKTGNGLLELNQPNTYAGRTLVQAGTLSVTNASGSGTGSGGVVVGSGATLAGTGLISVGTGNTINIASGGTLRGGDPSLTSGLGTLTVNRINIRDGANIYIRIPTAGPTGAASTGLSSGGTLTVPTNNSYIRVTETGGLTTTPTAINYILDGAGATFVFGQQYSYVIGRNDGTPLGAPTVLTSDPARFTFNNFNIAPDPTTISLSGDPLGFIYINFTPVPEPTTIVGLGAAVLALGGYVRRRRMRA